ncbi:MAG: hypothetical protein RJA15_657 [Actinomycetota bacterium]
MRIRTHISTAVAGALAAVLFLGACGESSSRSRNVALPEESPTITTINLPNISGTIDVAVDPLDNVYAVNFGSQNISRISADGTVEENWFELNEKPYALAVDSMGSVYVGAANGVVSKILSSGTLAYTIDTESPVWDITVDSEGRAIVNTDIGKIASITADGSSVVKRIALEIGARRIAVDKRGNFYAVNPGFNIVTLVTPEGVKTNIAVGEVPNDVKVSPSGDVYVANSTSGTVSKITYSLPDVSPDSLAISDTGIVYVLDKTNQSISRIGIDETVVTNWTQSGAKPADIAVGPNGSVYTANIGSNDLTKITPAKNLTNSPVAEEELQPARNPEFASPVQTADGFTVQIVNYSEDFTFSATSSGSGQASVDASGLVTVTGLGPDTEATVTVAMNRAGYADGSGTSNASSLRTAQMPDLGDPVRTADGFSVVIINFDPSFNFAVDTSQGSASVVEDGSDYRVVITGLDPDTAATVTVTTSREGYVSGTAEVTGSALAFPENPVRPVEEESTSTSTSTSTTTSTLETTSTVAIVATKTDVLIAPEVIVEAVASPVAGSAGVVVSVKTTEVVCSTDCVEALLGAANIDKGEVSVAIGDADPVPLSLDNPTKLAVGSKDTVLKFSVKASGGKETIINVPVTHSASIPETTDGSSGTPLLLIIAIVLAVALLAGAGLVIRKRNA